MKSKICLGLFALVIISLPWPAWSQDTIEVDQNTIPSPSVLPASFKYPIDTSVAQDSSITTDTPITDSFNNDSSSDGKSLEKFALNQQSYNTHLNAWSDKINYCLTKQLPKLVRTSTNSLVKFNGKPGTIVRNANNKLVCQI